MRAVSHRIRRPGDVDVREQIQVAEPSAGFGFDPWWTGTVVVTRVHDCAYEIGVEEQPPDSSPDRLRECGIFGGKLLTGDWRNIFGGEGSLGACGIDARLLGDPDRTKVRGKILRQRRFPGRF